MSLRFRLCPWGDIETGAAWWGIQAQAERGARYLHCAEDGKALVFPSLPAAKLKLAELRVAEQVREALP